MKQYNKINNLVGWLAFAIAAFTYCMTIEPTASFWDCPEFITTGYKLEVGHPPGAPFFMLTANLFSLFASDPSQVALMVNIMSALMSAACILFLFWSITHLTKKLVCPNIEDMTTGKIEITAHNHGFAVDAPIGETVDAPFENGKYGKVFVSHIDLNDNVVEGLQCVDIPAFSVQYHPEAAAGPHDAAYLFDRFVDLMRSVKEGTRNA